MKHNMRVTMADIARSLNVDASTVSLALRDSPKISQTTRDKIKIQAESMGYVPNPLISALVQTRNRPNSDLSTFAYISFEDMCEEIKNGPAFQGYIQGAEEEAKRNGFKFEKFCVTEKLNLKRINQIILARGISGVIIGPLPSGLSSVSMDWDKFSSITVGPTLHMPEIHCVFTDHFENVKIAYHVLVKRGHERIGLALMNSTCLRIGDRIDGGFFSQQAKLGVGKIIAPFKAESLLCDGLLDWINTHKLDALMTVRTEGLIPWLRENGVQIPTDLAVATVGTGSQDEQLSGMHESSYDIGSQAALQLLRLVLTNEKGIPKKPMRIAIPSHWNNGDTVL